MIDALRRGLAATAVVIGLLAAGPTARAADAETLEAARAFMKAMQIEATLDQVMPSILALMLNVVTKANPGQAPLVKDILERHFMALYKERQAEHIDGMAQIYALHFTAAELRELTAMYNTPTGRKFAEKQGEIGKQSMAFGARWSQGLNQELLRRIEPELRDRGLKTPI